MCGAMSRILVTGGAGFIGSTVADLLVKSGHLVRTIDNFSTGRLQFIEQARSAPNYEFRDVDLLDRDQVLGASSDIDVVIHLAANADVRFGWNHPTIDTQQNLLATQVLLEALRVQRVPRMIFASTGSVYGRAKQFPTPEDAIFPKQTSLYGASKLAAEGLIQAYDEAGLINSTIFRFVSILGPRYTHGHVFDFLKQLLANPNSLRVLGNGNQSKSYLHVDDCAKAIQMAVEDSSLSGVFNLGTEEFCTVKDSIRWICDEGGFDPEISFGSEDAGWIGDNPFIFLDSQRIRQRGWSSLRSIEESVRDTVRWILSNQWILE